MKIASSVRRRSGELPQPKQTGKRGPTVLQLVPALDQGGVERGTIEIANAIQRTGGRALVASEGGALEPRLRRAGAELIRMPLATKNPLKMRRNAEALKRILREYGVDVVHARSRAPAWSGYIAATETGTPFVTTYHGTYSEDLPLKRRYNAVMTLGRPVIAVSEFIAELLRIRHDVEASKIVTIPRGADLSIFSADAVGGARLVQLAREWGLESEARPIFLLPGRLTRWKGQSVFVEACAKLRERIGPSFLGLMVGGGAKDDSFPEELLRSASELGCGDCVKLAGPCTDMPAAYLLSSAVISASTDPEAFGRVAVEAQAMGRPVLASDHGGARETVENGVTGVLVPPGDPEALASAMQEFLDLDEQTREALGLRARDRAERLYSIKRMQAATLGVYEGVTGIDFVNRHLL